MAYNNKTKTNNENIIKRNNFDFHMPNITKIIFCKFYGNWILLNNSRHDRLVIDVRSYTNHVDVKWIILIIIYCRWARKGVHDGSLL